MLIFATLFRPQAVTEAADTTNTIYLGGKAINNWLYYLGFEPGTNTIQKMIDSKYDLIVMEPINTDKGNLDFPVSQVVSDLHNAPHPKLVLAYIDIGEAEDWRTYWKSGWGIGNPSWIVADDPDGWEGNFPVAYWHPEWQKIWLDPSSGYIQKFIDAGFDGIYLDWIEAYSDENVESAANKAGVNSEAAMVEFVHRLSTYGKSRKSNFIVVAQNAAELVKNDDYVDSIDALAQEQTWFDGSAENNPPGDCPLPALDSNVNTSAYFNSLSSACQQMYTEFPNSTLHVSSESYLKYLRMAQNKGLPVMTVDYAVVPSNVDKIYNRSNNEGFVPFVSERALAIYLPPVNQITKKPKGPVSAKPGITAKVEPKPVKPVPVKPVPVKPVPVKPVPVKPVPVKPVPVKPVPVKPVPVKPSLPESLTRTQIRNLFIESLMKNGYFKSDLENDSFLTDFFEQNNL